MLDLVPSPIRHRPPAGVTRLFLIRHGSTEANERKPFVLQGCEINGPLSELGRHQAQTLGAYLREFELHAVYASPLRRAMETAEHVAQPHQLPVTPIDGLRECSVGRWEGLSWEQIQEQDREAHDHFFGDPVNRTHPGGESYLDVLNRVEPAMQELLAKHVARTSPSWPITSSTGFISPGISGSISNMPANCGK